MIACPQRVAALHAHHDGELGAFSRWRLERHLATCPGCRASLAALEAIGDAARAQADAIASPDLWDLLAVRLPELDAAIDAGPPARGTRAARLWAGLAGLRGRQLMKPIGVAAAVAAVAAGFLLLRPVAPPDHVVRAVDGEGHVVMVLPSDRDATIIWVMDDGGGSGDPAPL